MRSSELGDPWRETTKMESLDNGNEAAKNNLNCSRMDTKNKTEIRVRTIIRFVRRDIASMDGMTDSLCSLSMKGGKTGGR